MERKLSSTEIKSFCGNVLPLRLLSDTPYNKDAITWSCDREDVVQITTFETYRYGGTFHDGVLLTLLSVGEATVTCRFEEKEYVCHIAVSPMRHVEPSRDLNYYIGDMHDHTWNKHKLAEFSERSPELYPICHYMKQVKEEDLIDFGAVSDHASVLSAADFYRGYADAEDIGEGPVFLPGCEGQVTTLVTDRYGVEHMRGGEVLMFNADTAFTTRSWEDFFSGLKRSPFAICGYPHPQVVGGSFKGIWDFCHRQYNTPRFQKLFRFVEMGDGSNRKTNMLHEYIYSVALDEGFHVSPTCSSDSHGPKWGFHRFPGKTVIMAQERSKEAFLDAILNNRMYASSTGNLKIFYTVNDQIAPATLTQTGVYRFHVELSYFRPEETDTYITRCQVMSDRGVTLLDLDRPGEVLDFTLTAPDAHYFYLRLLDDSGRKTWSCPVWTGKPFTKKREKKRVPLDKKNMCVYDRVSQKAVPTVICDDPLMPWHSECTTADLIFDLGKETRVSALSHYPKWLEGALMKQEGVQHYDKVKQFPSAYRISTSLDGENFQFVTCGSFRIFGGEETISFPAVRAKKIRLEILSTVGRAWEREEFADATLAIGEITLWKNL